MANPPSPSLEFVHASATLSRRFVSWLRRAAKNYGDLLELKAVIDNRLREERLKELTGAEKTKLTEAIMTYEKILADLGRIAKSETMDTFRITGEGLIKWVGDETISLGYTGMRERSAQYWLWDAQTGWRAEEISLPPEKKMTDVLGFYRVETYDVFHVPSQEEAERELLDFLENVKKWPRNRLGWLVGYVYPLKDETGGFWTVVRKVVELVSLRDVWEDLLEIRVVEDELMKMPQFEDLKTVLASELDAERRVREIVEEAKKELVGKYAERTEDIDRVKGEFSARAKEILSERVAPETKIGEVYEQVKPLIPADKVEVTRAGLRKAIRWAFLHPEISVDAFASGQIFPLGFTTEQAREIAAKILEKVTKKPPPPVAPLVVPFEERVQRLISKLKEEEAERKGLIISWETIERNYGLSFTEDERDRIKRYWIGRFPPNTEITIQWGITIPPPPLPPPVKSYEELKREFEGKDLVDALTIFVSRYRALQRDYLLEDLHRFLRELKTKLTDEDIYRFYKVYPDLKESLASIASLISWIPPPPPPKLKPEETGRLADFFIEKLRKAGVPLPAQYKAEFERALDVTKTYEENLAIIETVADDIIKKVVVVPFIPPRVEFVKVRFLKDMPAIVGADMKVYGPFAKGDVVELPKVNAEVIVKQEIATYTITPIELPTEEVEGLKAFVRAKVEQLRVEWKPEVWDRFWREYEARSRELWATKRISHVEDEVEHVLRAVAPPPVAPPTPPPPIRRELTKDEVKRLEDRWSDAFFRELGRVPANALAAFRVELEKVKDKSYGEAEGHILRVARELVAEFVARRVERVEVPPRIVVPYRPPPEEEFVAIGRVPPTEPPKEPLEPEEMRFPRGPSRREQEVLWNAFRYRLQEQGYNPFEYEDEFGEYIANTQFHSWKDLLEKYEVFVSSIKAGKALPPLWQWKGMPIPVGLEGVLRKTPAERLQDVIVHFTSVVIRNARTKGVEPTLEDLKRELEERALIPPDMIITPVSPLYDEIKIALMAAYKRKDTWLTNISLEELSRFLET